MPPDPQASKMLDRARGDEAMFGLLGSEADVPDWGVGFHAQQAIEKALKASPGSTSIPTWT